MKATGVIYPKGYFKGSFLGYFLRLPLYAKRLREGVELHGNRRCLQLRDLENHDLKTREVLCAGGIDRQIDR